MKTKTIITSFLFLTFLASCKDEVPFSGFNGFAQGTTYSVVFQADRKIKAEELKAGTEKILQDFDMSLSLYKDSSLLSRINRNETDIPDHYFSEVFGLSRTISEMTGGAFDVTVGPLVKAWGFGPDSKKDFSENKRDSLLQITGFRKVELRDGHLVKSDSRVSLDFNAIAQGYSVDIISRYFDRIGIKSYLVEIGGEVRVKGKRGDRLWKIGIDRPFDDNMMPGNDLQAIISLENRSLATSGNYRKFFEEEGVKYSHTIDPSTGYPARSRLLSATILASGCALADGIATACMVMGLERSVEFINMHPEFDAYLIYSDENGAFQAWSSDGLDQYISLNE